MCLNVVVVQGAVTGVCNDHQFNATNAAQKALSLARSKARRMVQMDTRACGANVQHM